MKITVLAENTSAREGVRSGHGLSLFIETAAHKILFDFGPDGEMLRGNAAALGVDLSEADIAILSHGHNDHSGGLAAFLEDNETATLYVHRRAVLPHYANAGGGYSDISADKALFETCADRIVWTEGVYHIDETLTLFSDVALGMPLFATNRTLFELSGGEYVADGFEHEQNLILREDGKIVLIGGCAHRGIVNIAHRAAKIEGRAPDAVFAGFHLNNPGLKEDEPGPVVAEVGKRLRALPCRYFTGHCTGAGPFELLQNALDERIAYMGGGGVFEI